MKRVEAVIREEQLPKVRAALDDVGYAGLTIMPVRGHGRQRGVTQQWRGREEVERGGGASADRPRRPALLGPHAHDLVSQTARLKKCILTSILRQKAIFPICGSFLRFIVDFETSPAQC